MIQGLKVLELTPDGIIGTVLSVPEFDVPVEFLQSVRDVHLNEGKANPNFQFFKGETPIATFYSGDANPPFMIEPNHVIFAVLDNEYDKKEMVKLLRIITNNLLLHIADFDFEDYATDLIKSVKNNGLDALKIERKPVDVAPKPVAEPKPAIKASSEEKKNEDPMGSFGDLDQLMETMDVEEIEEGTSAGGASDPFGGGGGGGASDPFGGGGGGGASDPFGGGGSLKDSEENFLVPDLEDQAFASDPWSTKEKEKKKDEEVDPFAGDPWG